MALAKMFVLWVVAAAIQRTQRNPGPGASDFQGTCGGNEPCSLLITAAQSIRISILTLRASSSLLLILPNS